MLGTDAQKYFQLRERRGLINDGYFKWTRNPNYVGEIMLYSSFGILVNDRRVWFIFSYMWSIVFVIRMALKEHSLLKKEGAKEYFERSWFLLPKWYGNAPFSIVFYIFVVAKCYMIYLYGIERLIKMIRA